MTVGMRLAPNLSDRNRLMTMHRVFIPSVVAESRLELPDSLHIVDAAVENGELVLEVASSEDLGSEEVNALYGNIDEDDTEVHFGMFEKRR